jgi:hypothetical protein
LTVWRSEDGTSMDCGAISARICADTIWLAIVEALLVQGAEAQRAAEHRAPRERQAVLLRSGSPPTLAMRWTARPLPGPHAGYRGARRAPRLVEPSRVPSRSFAFIPGGERRIPKRPKRANGRRQLKAGCAYPGDIGALSDGFLRLFARTSDLIIRVGANVECRKARRSRPLWSPRPI